MQRRSPANLFLQTIETNKVKYLDGHLSFLDGFFPAQEPLTKFLNSHEAWNAVIEQIPHEIKKPNFRAFVESIPLLPTDADSLPDDYLPFAATFLVIIAHAYLNCRATPEKPELPNNILKPWQEVSKRLGRSSLNMDIVDLFMNNWYVKDATLPKHEKYQVENLDIIIPTFANEAERVFYLTFVEMTHRSRHLVNAVVNAQDAIVNNNDNELQNALLEILKLLDNLAAGLLKADLNPHSKTYLDPLLLTKTTSFFGVPSQGITSTVSGAFSPIFLILDIALGRIHFNSEIGKQIKGSYAYIPKIYQDFFAEVSKISVSAYIKQSQNAELKSLYAQVLQRYAGKGGLLSLHRDKAAYGILNVGTRIGRIETVAGLVTKQAKPWVKISDELDEARHERPNEQMKAAVNKYHSTTNNEQSKLKAVTLKSENHIYYTAGDHVQIQPTNSKRQIEEITQLLELPANYILNDTQSWKQFLAKILHEKAPEQLTLTTCLKYGNISSLKINRIKQLFPYLELPKDENITNINLADLIVYVKTKQPALLKQVLANMTELVMPLAPRSYSISSPSNHQLDAKCPFAMDLTVSKVTYAAPELSKMTYRNADGVASQYLIQETQNVTEVPINVHPSYRFRLPESKNKPIVLIATGSGIAPMRAFYRQNSANNEGRDIFLFYGIKTSADMVVQEELNAIANISNLKYVIATSQEGEHKRITDVIAKEYVNLICDLIEKDAVFYVCGSTEFVSNVQQLMFKVIAENYYADNEHSLQKAKDYFHTHIAPSRFFSQEFSTNATSMSYPLMPMHEICMHNNSQHGYWTVINNYVYDMTEYVNFHPGGHYLLKLNAGIDATEEFMGVHAHVDSINTMHLAERYKIGKVDHPEFRDEINRDAYIKLSTFLSSITAYQNLMAIDFFITSKADYYWLLKALEAHDRFINFVHSHILPDLENLKLILIELNTHFAADFMRQVAASLPIFPYEKNKFGDIVNTTDNDEKITQNVYDHLQKVQQSDHQLLSFLKSNTIISIKRLVSNQQLFFREKTENKTEITPQLTETLRSKL